MRLTIGLVLLCFAVSCHGAAQIVGGSDARKGTFPWQASFQFNDLSFCSGSIISNRYILTAAHCASPYMEQSTSITVVAGTAGGKEQSYQSDKIVLHPDYNPVNVQNDIALVRLSQNISLNDKVQIIGLTKRNDYPDGYPVTLTGWGSFGSRSPNDLQMIKLKIIDQEKCRDAYKNVADVNPIMDSQICTETRKEQGACQGDSGGPLVADGVQVGVASFGIACTKGFPGVFARVSSFRSWIASNTG